MKTAVLRVEIVFAWKSLYVVCSQLIARLAQLLDGTAVISPVQCILSV
jgi:hypothetical protein